MSRRSLVPLAVFVALAVGVAWFVARPGARTDAVVPPTARDLEAATAGARVDVELAAPTTGASDAATPADRTAARVEQSAAVVRAQHLVNGRVVDDRGEPVASFVVRADPVGESDGRMSATDRFQGRTGAFSLRYATDGEWTIGVLSDDGLYAEAQTARFPEDAERSFEFVLARSASVEGVVYGLDGRPASGVRVEAHGADGVDIRLHRSFTTREDGAFALVRLPARPLEIRARADGGLSASAPVTPLPADRASGIVLALRRGGAIEGRLVDALGAPRAETSVWSWREETAGRAPTTTDLDGSFRFDDLVPGAYVVIAPESGGGSGVLERAVTVDHERVVHIDLGAGAPPPIRVRGTVRTSGPASGATVVFERVDAMRGGPDYHERDSIEQVRVAARAPAPVTATTNTAGAYELGIAAPGSYTARVLLRGTTIHARTVNIQTAETQTVDFAFGASSIAGRVLGVDGAPTTSSVRIEPAGCDVLASPIAVVDVATDATGAFAVDGLRAGAYFVSAREPADVSRFDAAAARHRARIDLGEDERRTGVELRLGRPGTVRVLVLGLEGGPEADAMVSTDGARSFHPTRTDAQGVALLHVVPPGDATIDVVAPAAALGAQAAVASARLVVEPDRITEVTVRVVAAGRVEVRIDAERADPTAVTFVVIDANGFEVERGSSDAAPFKTTSRGGVVTRPLAPGAYRVRAQIGDRVVETTVRVEALKTVEAVLR